MEGKYYSETLKTIVYVYPSEMPFECECCGKLVKKPICFTRDDDEECLEYTYGSECIKKLKLRKA